MYRLNGDRMATAGSELTRDSGAHTKNGARVAMKFT